MSATDQVWAMVSGLPSGKRKRRLLMVLQAYIDDSGSEPQSPVFVLAGFVASATQWAAFSNDWQDVLDQEPKLAYFKATQAERLQDEFDRRKGWTSAKRKDRIISLARVIRKHIPEKFFVAVGNRQFSKYMKGIKVPRNYHAVDTPYFMLFYHIILCISAFHSLYRAIEPCDFIFDDQGSVGKQALSWWDFFKVHAKHGATFDFSPFLGSPPCFKDDKVFLPLQAADLFAWHVRRGFSLSQTLLVPARSAETVLAPIGGYGKVFNDSDLRQLRSFLLQVQNRAGIVNPSAQRVSAGSRKPKRESG
jgi:hypothetical protein